MFFRTWMGVAGLGITAAFLTACAGGGSDGQTQGALSSEEVEGVVRIREEEKLARDVYADLEVHDPSFVDIGRSEQMHMDAVGTLLGRYGVADPAEGNSQGQFTSAELQDAYDALIERGAASRLAALTVGVEIEELDIYDIQEAQEAVTHTDVARVYDNLTRGSRNHLRSFYGQLVTAGGSYTPKYLDQGDFDAIIETPVERGP